MPSNSGRSPRVSIVIRALNEGKHIGNLLEAIKKQSLQDLEIILVDSGSSDDTLAIAARYPVKVLHIQPHEFTFGRSLNIGLGAARGDLAVMASAHVLPLGRDWLEQLTAPFEDAKVALAYGKQHGGESSRFSEAQHFKRWFPEQSNFDRPNAFCNNANLALRLAFWKEHAFNETLTGLEDLAWASAMREQGYKVAYVAEASVAHLHDETAGQIVNRHRREALALKHILPASRFNLWHFASLYFRSVVSDFRAARRERRWMREAGGILSFRFLQYLGTYLGYHDPLDPSAKLKQVFYYPPGSLEDRSPKAGPDPLESSRSQPRHDEQPS